VKAVAQTAGLIAFAGVGVLLGGHALMALAKLLSGLVYG
jgi:hypothetical protein